MVETTLPDKILSPKPPNLLKDLIYKKYLLYLNLKNYFTTICLLKIFVIKCVFCGILLNTIELNVRDQYLVPYIITFIDYTGFGQRKLKLNDQLDLFALIVEQN